MMNETFLALEALLTRYVNLFSENAESSPTVEFETEWLSECITKTGDKPGFFYWKPKKRHHSIDFQDLEKALELEFHEDIKTFFSSFWSNGICVEREDINFSLIQIWNEEDEAHLKENILGHVFAKIKAKLPITYFIGSTFGDEVICLDHATGNIVLEKPGYKAHKILANSLSSFLVSLQPTVDPYNL